MTEEWPEDEEEETLEEQVEATARLIRGHVTRDRVEFAARLVELGAGLGANWDQEFHEGTSEFPDLDAFMDHIYQKIVHDG